MLEKECNLKHSSVDAAGVTFVAFFQLSCLNLEEYHDCVTLTDLQKHNHSCDTIP